MLDKDAHEGVSRPGRTALQQVIPWEVLAAAECGKNKSMKCLQFLKKKVKISGMSTSQVQDRTDRSRGCATLTVGSVTLLPGSRVPGGSAGARGHTAAGSGSEKPASLSAEQRAVGRGEGGGTGENGCTGSGAQ